MEGRAYRLLLHILTPGAGSVGGGDFDGQVGREGEVAAERVDGVHSRLSRAVVDLQHLQPKQDNSL